MNTPAPVRIQAQSFQIFSMGPDGVPNTRDDLKAWE